MIVAVVVVVDVVVIVVVVVVAVVFVVVVVHQKRCQISTKNAPQLPKSLPKSSLEASQSPFCARKRGVKQARLILDPFLDPQREPKGAPNRPRDAPRGPQRPPKFKKSCFPVQLFSQCGFGAKFSTLFIDFYGFLDGPTTYSDAQAQCLQHVPQKHVFLPKT